MHTSRDFLENLNANSLSVVTACVEPSLASVATGQRFQFGRHEHFVTDLEGHAAVKKVFNRVKGDERHVRKVLSW